MTSKSETSEELDNLRQDLAELRADLKGLVRTVTDGRAAGLAQHANHMTGDIEDSARQAYGRLVDGVQQTGQSLERTITEHPFGAATIAVAAGVIIGRLFDGARR